MGNVGRNGGSNIPRPPMAKVKRYIAEAIGDQPLTLEQVLGPRRFAPLVAVRNVVMTRLLEEGYSLHGVGYRFGGRDPTTVYKNVKRHRAKPKIDR